MASPSQPLPPNDDKGPMLLGVYWGLFPVTLAVMGLRFYSRICLRRLDWDDWFMLAAWVVYLGALIISTIVAVKGGGRHVEYLGPDQAILIAELTIIIQPFAIMGNALAKTSIAILLQRIMGPGSLIQKWLLWITTAIFWTLCLLASIMVFAQCSPPSALWSLNPAAKADCIRPQISETINVVHGSWGAFQDFFLATLPLSIIWKLQISWDKKIGLCALLALGVFSGICAIIKTTYLPLLISSTDITWLDSSTFLWSYIENVLFIFCSSVPTAKPVWDRLVHKKPIRPSTAAYYGRPSDRYELSKRNKIYNTVTTDDLGTRDREMGMPNMSTSSGGWEHLEESYGLEVMGQPKGALIRVSKTDLKSESAVRAAVY
ncbi:hypothetical protein MMC17_005697 [Xylographa soralifera]|nr:hypothetical protein [Xylographa soralifera]